MDNAFTFPSRLSALTALTYLQFIADGAPQLDRLAELSALQSLDVSLRTGATAFPECVTVLQKLSSLVIDSAEADVSLCFDWKNLASLAHVEIYGCVRFVSPLQNLACLESLQEVYLANLRDATISNITQVAALAYELGLKRPEVVFSQERNSFHHT